MTIEIVIRKSRHRERKSVLIRLSKSLIKLTHVLVKISGAFLNAKIVL